MMEEYQPYLDLGHAVVTQAVEDYKSKLGKLKEVINRGGVIKVVTKTKTKKGYRTNTYYITTESVEKELIPLENFFRGDWCYQLSGLDGDALIMKLRRGEGIDI